MYRPIICCNCKDWQMSDNVNLGTCTLKLDYKSAFKLSWNKADKQDRAKIKKIPNFDKDMFFEISGIDVDKYDN